MPSEETLIDGCKRGHPPAQEALYRRYWSFAMSVCLRYAASREDALEAAHDAFLRLFRTIHAYDPERPFEAWFRRLLVRAAIDRYRAARPYHDAVEALADPPEAAVDAAHSISLEADDILALLRRLSPVQRAVFNLHEVEGYSHDEIGGLLGIAPGTSRASLSRARRRLGTLYHASIWTAP